MTLSRRSLARGLAAAPLAYAAIRTGATFSVSAQEGPVRIGSKNFTEQLILGEMYALLLENAGIATEKKLNLAGTEVAQAALVAGEIDLYPEYTGTGLTVVLGMPVNEVMTATPVGGMPESTPVGAEASLDQRVYDLVSDGYVDQFDLIWLDQSAFNDTQALVITQDAAEGGAITTISQLVPKAGELTIVAAADALDRDDGIKGIEQTYGLKFGNVLTVDPSLRYQAIEGGQAQAVLAFSTDGQIAGMGLVLLDDDKNLWLPYHVAPVVREATLTANPGIADALNPLAPVLTDEIMAGLNWQVDGPDKLDPEEVARTFLTEQGLISS
ncbi:MAG: quaternary ammonium transporter [Chloroflexota bacterium]|nr:quaternary ammonium transporter [Chloroflexota bacterium]